MRSLSSSYNLYTRYLIVISFMSNLKILLTTSDLQISNYSTDRHARSGSLMNL